ncbi:MULTISPECIES: hypothetical protein [Neisseria]|uniref:Membrane lipoprotein n=1 Tax=Neisseria musculi TaxID=1815583 RepID=A0A7H1MEQ0_9NEIS|nr:MULTISPECIES: hypothetical protein [Neisseria]MBF0803028.1 hypothetical protein [Neisseria sp. 19428wB4_WF04]QNT60115.1 hypothetical protein H7A79_0935 [Neisseria musculi]TFU44321.1 hypothetical protein E4T99_01380 [Neisseria sp. WF04]
MKRIIALSAISTLALAACKDDTQARLEQQQKQIEALQQQLAQQNAQQDNTVYELTADAVKDTIPAEYQANGNNGEPVTGTDGQQYIYDQSTGSWLLQSLVGAAAGAFIGNALANKFQKAQADTPAVRRARADYYQSAQAQQRTSRQLNTKSLPAQNQAAQQNYRQTTQAPSNTRRPMRRGGFRRR